MSSSCTQQHFFGGPAMSHKTLRTYLSGGMEFAKGEGADWRRVTEDWLRKNLGHSAYNPNSESEQYLAKKYPSGRFRELKNENIDKYTELVRDLIDGDCREIAERSDYVICNWDESAQRGAGTTGELTMARFVGKPVYMVTQMKLQDIPGWVLGCATKIFGTFKDLQEFLVKQYAGIPTTTEEK
jgi:hypothetical protein